MNLRSFLALFLFFLHGLSFAGDLPVEMNFHSFYQKMEKKLITTPRELEKLGLFGTDFRSQEYLDEMLASFWEGLELNNYYLVFYKTLKMPYIKLSQIRSENLTLKGYIRVSKWNDKCSTYQPLNYSVIKYGKGLSSALEGICGQIATVHSLKKLGLMKNPFKGPYLKEKNLTDVAPISQKNKGGMTANEIAFAHKKYTGKGCSIYHHICSLDTRKIPAPQQEKIEKLAKKGLKTFVAKLYRQMNGHKPKYDCSLGMTSFDSKGEKKLSHVEHITKIALNPKTKKALVVTKNGLDQGDMKKRVPSNAGNNTFSIDPENLECYFEKSTHKAINKIYQDASLDRVEAICCPL